MLVRNFFKGSSKESGNRRELVQWDSANKDNDVLFKSVAPKL